MRAAPRDPQREAVYTLEDGLVSTSMQASLTDCRHLVAHAWRWLVGSHHAPAIRLVDRIATGGVPLADGEVLYASYTPAGHVIELLRPALTLGIVLHELAHGVVAHYDRRDRVEDHGAEFMGVYLAALDRYCGIPWCWTRRACRNRDIAVTPIERLPFRWRSSAGIRDLEGIR